MTIDELIKSTSPMPLPKRVLLNLLVAQNVVAEKMTEALKPSGITAEQFNVLRILRGQKGAPANMCVIQERMLARTSNTTRLVDKLLAKALVTRNICPDNRRKMEVLITAKGLALLSELDARVEAAEQYLTQSLTAVESEQLNQLLEKFRNQP